MACDEWRTLVRRYRTAVKEYSEAVAHLSVVPGPEFSESWHRAERARKLSDGSRAALLTHEHDHACLVNGRFSGDGASSDQPTDELILGDQGQPGG